MIFGLIIINSFINLYSQIVNDYFQSNTYYTLASDKKIDKKILANNNVHQISVGIILKIDLDNDVLKMTNPNTTPEEVTLDDFMINEEYTPVYSINHIDNINKNEIIIGLPFKSLSDNQKEYMNSIIGKELNFLSIDEKKVYKFRDKRFKAA